MDLKELNNTMQQRNIGLAYEIWRLASLTRHPFVKDFPRSPEEACPELYPPTNSIKMPDFLLEKWLKRGGK